MKSINIEELKNEELLKYAINSGIININNIADDVKNMERTQIIAQHPYKIWMASDGRWKTYLEDPIKKEGRRLIARKSESEINDIIVDDYKKNHVERRKIYQLFYDWIEFEKGDESISDSTLYRYISDYKKFLEGSEFIAKDILTVSEHDVINFLKDLVRSRRNKNQITKKCFTNIKIVVNGIFTYAKTEKELNCVSIANALQNFKLSERYFKHVIHKDSEQVYSDVEIEALGRHIIKKYVSKEEVTTRQLGILFMILTGVRLGELVSLKWSDKDNDKLYIQRTETRVFDENGKAKRGIKEYPKTVDSMDGVELTESAMIVWDWIQKLNFQHRFTSEFVFYESEYGNLKGYHFYSVLEQLCKECNVKYRSPHKLRKTYASMLFANDVEEKIVQKQMRHKNSATTHKHYEFSVRGREYKRKQLNSADVIKVKDVAQEIKCGTI